MVKKIMLALSLAIILPAINASAWDLKDLKGVLGGGSGNSAANTVGSILSGLLTSENLTVKDLAGSWAYNSPAVTFKSDNLLQKAGGTAAASALEQKLAPYYKTAGIDNMRMIINTDSTFTLTVRRMNLSGTIETIESAKSGAETAKHNFVFRFKALKAINIGAMNAYVTKSPQGQLNLMFDVTKLVTLVEKIGSVTNNATVNGAVSLLKSYDGVCAGFTLDPVR